MLKGKKFNGIETQKVTALMSPSAWRYYAKFYRQSYRTLGLSVVASVAQSLLFLPITFLIRYAFDKIIPSGNFRLLALSCVAIVLLNLTGSAITLWIRYTTLRITKVAIRDLRDELLNRCYAFSRSYYSLADRGKLSASIVWDTERLDTMSNALAVQLLPSIVICITLSAVLIYLNWFLFIVLVSVAPILLLTSQSMKKRAVERYNHYRQSLTTYSKGIFFLLQMMDLTRIQTAEPFEVKRQRKNLEELRLTSTSLGRLNTAYSELQNAIIVISGVLILIVGGKAVAAGSMTLGGLLSFCVAIALMSNYLRNIWSTIPQIITGNESLITLFNIMKTEDRSPYSGRKQITFSGKITLESVSFQYKDQWVLQDISLTINPNTQVAVLGPNGAGKTTIAHLILGLYSPKKVNSMQMIILIVTWTCFVCVNTSGS